jgi:hypothetical protein
VTLLDGLAERGGNGDGQIAGDFFSADAFGGKGENVGRFVLVAELAIEFADGRIGGQQHRDLAFEANGRLRLSKKVNQRAGGGKAEILLCS